MKTRFPLYLKILFWFFLNVAFLCAAFLIVARVQFRFGWDSLISGPAGEPLQNVTRLLTAELANRPRAEWNDVLKESGDEHHVKFYLFHNAPGQLEQVAGEPVELPPTVLSRVMSRPGMNGPPRGPGDPGMDEPPGPRGDNPDFQPPPPREGGPPMQRDGPPPRFMVHEAGHYWVVMPVFPGHGQRRDVPPNLPLPATLIVSSATLSAGGLFFNPTPWVIAGIAVIVFSTLFWFPLVRGITRSLSQMTAATEKIAEGRFDVRTQVHRQDELGALSGAIDGMAGRLSGLVTGQKRFLGDIAHELCSPIARIQVALGILEQRADDSQKARLEDLREEVEQMSGLVNELLSFSRASLGKTNIKLQPVALRAVVEKAAARECGPDSGATVSFNIPEDLRAIAEPELLLRAVANVLRNAVRYAAGAGPIQVSAARENETILLQIEDSGPGIPESALPQLFDPFYRVDSSRTRDTGGVGLGLSIVKTCVESCSGSVGCENRQPSGLRVILRLPAESRS
jgi:two-component system, OmpR family, sensor histidine kinase CpxA